MTWMIHISPDAYPGAAILVPLGSVMPKPTGGTARWNKIQRPRRRDMLEFDGEDPIQLEFSILLDAFPDGDMEPLIARIWGWAARVALPFEPPTLTLEGPVPFAELPYKLVTVEEMENVERRADGRRSRQELKLTLLEYIAADVLGRPSPAVAAQQKAATRTVSLKESIAVKSVQQQRAAQRTYTIRQGDTLASIAAKQLGDTTRWQEIARINTVRDPRRLQVGAVLRLP